MASMTYSWWKNLNLYLTLFKKHLLNSASLFSGELCCKHGKITNLNFFFSEWRWTGMKSKTTGGLVWSTDAGKGTLKTSNWAAVAVRHAPAGKAAMKFEFSQHDVGDVWHGVRLGLLAARWWVWRGSRSCVQKCIWYPWNTSEGPYLFSYTLWFHMYDNLAHW